MKGHGKLEWLGLIGTEITDARWVHLKELTPLKELTLYKSKVTDAGVRELRKALPYCLIDS